MASAAARQMVKCVFVRSISRRGAAVAEVVVVGAGRCDLMKGRGRRIRRT